jgi:hypothetical protein
MAALKLFGYAQPQFREQCRERAALFLSDIAERRPHHRL